jgi:exodeoxyribonuclease VII small subunit
VKVSIEQNKINEMSFEESLKELEKIVERLSTGETSLDELLSLYEAGVAYLKHCQSRLGAAEAKIKILSEQLSPRLDTEGNNG